MYFYFNSINVVNNYTNTHYLNRSKVSYDLYSRFDEIQ